LSLTDRVKSITGTGLGCFGMVLWFITGVVCFVWALWVLFDTFGAWTILIGLFLAPITYIASFFIVWFSTDVFPIIMLIPYVLSFVSLGLVLLAEKLKGEEL